MLTVMMMPSGMSVPLVNVAIAIPPIMATTDCTAPITAEADPAFWLKGASANADAFGEIRAVVIKKANCNATTSIKGAFVHCSDKMPTPKIIAATKAGRQTIRDKMCAGDK